MSDVIEVKGVITELLPNAVFAVQLDDGRNINAPVHGSLRAVYTRFACGDRVTVTLSPDGSYARVTGFAG